jgi:hypothetical protein
MRLVEVGRATRRSSSNRNGTPKRLSHIGGSRACNRARDRLGVQNILVVYKHLAILLGYIQYAWIEAKGMDVGAHGF